MIPTVRTTFNQHFTPDIYAAFLKDLDSRHPGAIDFRVAETPIFIPKAFKEMIIDTCEHIVDMICAPDFLSFTDRAIPTADLVPNQDSHPQMISFDFGICQTGDGSLEPRLIEMQAFPTLYGFQVYHPETIEKHFNIPAGFSNFLNGFDKERYLKELQKVILNEEDPRHVILLEIRPHQQKTRIDFYCTQDYLGIETVCITALIAEENRLYYYREGQKIQVRRIYNRVIFDELHAQKESLGPIIDITAPWDVTWIPHPNWFYRVSKYTLPFIRHPYVPATFFLNEVKQLPEDLDQYVLKPLFSFAGQGVIIDIKQADLESIKDPENWILQRKVQYADVIKTPDVPAKAEIRMMYLWKEGDKRPTLVTNLARLSKGKMIGVRYNKDKEWVGASVAYFES